VAAKNLEVSVDCVAGHFERFLTSLALGVAAGQSGDGDAEASLWLGPVPVNENETPVVRI